MEKLYKMKRYEIINRIIQNKGYSNYLEIGVRDGECFRAINVSGIKIGVDPDTNSQATDIVTSDDFFAGLNEDVKFDIIFIDGLHLDYQVDLDIQNSLKHLSENGTIVLHDCNPPTHYHAAKTPIYGPPTNGEWNGTVYLSLIKLRLYHKDLVLKTVDTDWGVGILTRGINETINAFPNEATTWSFFNNNRNQILDLISPDDFNALYPIK